MHKRILEAYGICRWNMYKADNYRRPPQDLYELGKITTEGRKKSMEKRNDTERDREWDRLNRAMNRVKNRFQRRRNQ